MSVVVGVGVLCAAAVVQAQQAEAPPAEATETPSVEATVETPETQARDLSVAAGAAYGEGRPEDAIRLFAEAFRLVPDPSFAYNMAAIYDELERGVDATNYYTLYLQLFPGAPDRADVEARLTALAPEVQAAYALLDATSIPTGAEVYQIIGQQDRYLGVTPLEWWVEPGELVFEFRHPGYVAQQTHARSVPGLRMSPSVELERIVVVHETPVDVVASREVERALEVAEARATTAAVAIQAVTDAGAGLSIPTVEPTGVNVWLDGEWIGQAPARFDGLEPGSYELELTADGYHSQSMEVTLEEGVALGIPNTVLEPMMLRMLVSSDTSETWLYANEERFGVLRYHDESAVFEIPYGPDYLMAYARHRHPLRVDLIGVEPGEDVVLELDMRRHWNQRWLRTWVSIGAIAAASSVTAVWAPYLNDDEHHDAAVQTIQLSMGAAAVTTLGMVVWGILDRYPYYPTDE